MAELTDKAKQAVRRFIVANLSDLEWRAGEWRIVAGIKVYRMDFLRRCPDAVTHLERRYFSLGVVDVDQGKEGRERQDMENWLIENAPMAKPGSGQCPNGCPACLTLDMGRHPSGVDYFRCSLCGEMWEEK
jgi:hypothetical protein